MAKIKNERDMAATDSMNIKRIMENIMNDSMPPNFMTYMKQIDDLKDTHDGAPGCLSQ